MKRLSLPYQLMFLSAMVLAVYYPTQFAEISLVDDAGVINSILNSGPIHLRDIFVPRTAGGGYYRPFIGLSYLLDKQFWFLDERLLHFEWIVAHLVNGILVFFLCREAVSLYLDKRSTYLPLAAALLFSLHPITAESVNWISGRTDVMMGNFILPSAFLLLRYRRNPKPILLWLSVAAAMLALLAKEAAFGWLLGFTIIFMYRPMVDEADNNTHESHKIGEWLLFAIYFCAAFLTALFFRLFWLVSLITLAYFVHQIRRQGVLRDNIGGVNQIRRRLIVLSSVATVAIIMFIVLRRIAYVSDVGKIGQTIALMGSDVNYTLSIFLGAIGFYLKKFFMPVPLNFFIREIDPLYDFLGIAALLVSLRLFLSRSLPALLFLAGLFLMLPALPFAFGTIAWTAYAERYIYLSTAFWVVALCLWTGRWLEGKPGYKSIAFGAATTLCLISAGITFARNLTWRTNVDLMADTVAKSPNQKKLHDIYMYALLRAGRVEEAKKEYRDSCSIHDIFYDPSADLIMGGELRKEGQNREALQLYMDALKRCKNNRELLAAVLDLAKRMGADSAISAVERKELSVLEHEFESRLAKITEDSRSHAPLGTNSMRRGR